MSGIEEWRPRPDGIYAVSNMGRVRREVGGGNNARAGRVLKAGANNHGYRAVLLYDANGGRRACTVHALVAEAFLGPRPLGMQVNHKNGIKTDARAENLEYVTPSENLKHAYATGLSPSQKGEANQYSKLTDAQVREIRTLHATTRMSQSAIAARFAVTQSLVSYVLSGSIWRHVA